MAWQTPSIPFGKTIQYPQDQGGKIIGYTEQLPSPGMSGNLYSMIASLPFRIPMQKRLGILLRLVVKFLIHMATPRGAT